MIEVAVALAVFALAMWIAHKEKQAARRSRMAGADHIARLEREMDGEAA